MRRRVRRKKHFARSERRRLANGQPRRRTERNLLTQKGSALLCDFLKSRDHRNNHRAAFGVLVEVAAHGRADGLADLAVILAAAGRHAGYGILRELAQLLQQLLRLLDVHEAARHDLRVAQQLVVVRAHGQHDDDHAVLGEDLAVVEHDRAHVADARPVHEHLARGDGRLALHVLGRQLDDRAVLRHTDLIGLHAHALGHALVDLEHALLNYLVKQARAETPGQARTQIPYLAVVHRLDQPVEGVLVFAKNKDAAGKLGRQVKDGTMKKEYLAVCEGKIEKQGVQKFEDFLVKDGRSNTSRVVQPGTAGAKKAVLEYEVIRTQENRTLVQIHLGTGRHHQIRVQFSHAGYPLAGDAKYGAKEKGSLALCAHHLELKHPRTGKRLSFTVKPEGEIFHSFV